MLKKKDIVSLQVGISKVSNMTGSRFVYAIAKNARLIKPEIESINETLKQTDEYKKYEKERIALAEKYAKKDGQGNAIIIPNRNNPNVGDYDIDDKKKFNEELEKLNDKNKKVIEAREKQEEEYGKLLEEETEDFKFHKIKFDDLPENITSGQLIGISLLLEDEDISKKPVKVVKPK
jgi:DNA-directed RNA polymerase specialized sigma subunit